MNAAIETLRKILQLESQKGFQNNCVVGGLDKAGPMWRQQAAQAALPAGFVGTLATIYSVGGSDNEATIKNKMAAEVNPKTGNKIFNFASGISLLLFYAFAMQCASTLAVTKKETNSWKWPLGQLIFMSSFAYIVALLAYQLLK